MCACESRVNGRTPFWLKTFRCTFSPPARPDKVAKNPATTCGSPRDPRHTPWKRDAAKRGFRGLSPHTYCSHSNSGDSSVPCSPSLNLRPVTDDSCPTFLLRVVHAFAWQLLYILMFFLAFFCVALVRNNAAADTSCWRQ